MIKLRDLGNYLRYRIKTEDRLITYEEAIKCTEGSSHCFRINQTLGDLLVWDSKWLDRLLGDPGRTSQEFAVTNLLNEYRPNEGPQHYWVCRFQRYSGAEKDKCYLDISKGEVTLARSSRIREKIKSKRLKINYLQWRKK